VNVTHTGRFRIAALLTLTLFLSGWTGKALGVQPCLHHDMVVAHGGVVAVAEGAADVHHHADAGGHHAHGHPAAGADAGSDSDPHASHGECTCSGGCPAQGVAGLPEAPRTPSALTDAAAAKVPAAPDALPARFGPYVLPYGTAPPRA
jgi:hypothetical protein